MGSKFLLGLMLVTALTACGKAPPPPKPVPTPPVVPIIKPTEAEALEAFRRGFKKAEKFCHLDGHGYIAFFKQPISEDWKEEWNGWWLYKYEDVPFYFSEKNKTWFNGDTDVNKSIKVYPDVAGLACLDKALS